MEQWRKDARHEPVIIDTLKSKFYKIERSLEIDLKN